MDFESIMQIGICFIVGVFVGRVTYRLLLYCPKRHRRLEKEDYCSRARQKE